MKKYLLPKEGNFYKANLHAHSTVSDGKKTPEELKELYQEMGYSIVAYTDHSIFITHNDLTDDNFLALNGYEWDVNEHIPNVASWLLLKCCHLCFIALDKDNDVQPVWNEKCLYENPNNNARHYLDVVKYDKSAPPYERVYTAECINGAIKMGREKGFFVTYNHPTWSLESYPEYMSYEGMHAFEMFNGSLAVGHDDYNPRVYDDILRGGKRIYCLGTDDNHNGQDKDSRLWDSGVAFTMIKADNLEYKTITDAMLEGNFYCSEAPEIYELYIEDDRIHIECSEADRIICSYQSRRVEIEYAEKDGYVTSADFTIDDIDEFFRITVIDKSGKHACTNAYFLDCE